MSSAKSSQPHNPKPDPFSTGPQAAEEEAIAPGLLKTRLQDTWRLLRANHLTLIGLGILIIAILVSLFAPVLAPYDPLDQELARRLQPPSLEHLMGTDGLGRDVLSRVIYGGRISLPAALGIVLVSMAIGILMGSVAGYAGGKLDSGLMRFTDLIMGFPPIILAMIVAAALGPGLLNSAVAVIIVWWPMYARLLRGMVMGVKQDEFVQSARAIGASHPRILFRTILPNCLGPAVVLAAVDMGAAILTFASLSFLGLGAVPPTPEWGAMVGKGIFFFDQWWISGFPGLAIFMLVLGFNFIGDGLRDALDPRFSRS